MGSDEKNRMGASPSTLTPREVAWVSACCDAEVPTEAEQARRAEMARPGPAFSLGGWPSCGVCGSTAWTPIAGTQHWWKCCCGEQMRILDKDTGRPDTHDHECTCRPDGPCDCGECPHCAASPADLDAVEAALGPEPERVEGKVLREGWITDGEAKHCHTVSITEDRFMDGMCYVKLVEVSPTEESQPIDPADQARADRNIAACARVTDEAADDRRKREPHPGLAGCLAEDSRTEEA